MYSKSSLRLYSNLLPSNCHYYTDAHRKMWLVIDGFVD